MKIFKLAVYFSIALIVGCNTSDVFFKDALCIENISIIDPINGLSTNQTIIIKNGKISQIISSKEINLSDQNTIIDGGGKFVIPGLWDAHVHYAYMENLAPYMNDLFLKNGITSVRDTGGKIEFLKKWKDLSLKDPTNTPRVMIAGPLLDGSPNVYNGSDAAHPPLSVELKTVNDVTERIEELDSIGVNFLKAYEMLTPEQFKAATSLAQQKGLKVTGHVPLSMDVISASNAGLNSMEHLRNLEMSCASNWEDLLNTRLQMLSSGGDESGADLRSKIHATQRIAAIDSSDRAQTAKVLGVLAKNQTWQIPTMALYETIGNRPVASFNTLPEEIFKDWKSKYDLYTKAPSNPDRLKYSQWQADMINQVHKAGIGIMAGTDTPIGLLVPGRSLHDELRLLVSSGLTPLEAIKTATYNPAKYFNLENELGSVQENMWADLIILDKNPLDDITNTLNINTVIKQGVVFNSN